MKLELENLCAGYGPVPVLRNVSCPFEPGKITSVVGPNGSGKSTLLKTAAGILKPSSGTVRIDGRSLNSFPRRELAKVLAFLPQNHSAPEDFSVERLVGCGRFPHDTLFSCGLSAADRAVVEKMLEMTHLGELRTRRLASLSGGERQRAWIAMALAQEPQILLLDEPTTFLDIRFRLEILSLIRSLNRTLGITIVMVIHDLNLAIRCSDSILALKDGAAAASGTPEAVFTPDFLRRVFSVEAEVSTARDGLPLIVPSFPGLR